MNDAILFSVGMGNIRVIVWATDREEAKRQAHSWIGGNVESYVVTAISNKGDRVRIQLTLSV